MIEEEERERVSYFQYTALTRDFLVKSSLILKDSRIIM